MIANLREASDAEIQRLLAHPNEITRFLYGSEAAQRKIASLDRAWHAIHFVLNGSRLGGAPPLNFLVDEGTAVGDVDVGFGPARVLSSAQVQSLAGALSGLDPDAVRGRVDVRQLDEMTIYPGAWQSNGLDGDYVAEHYRVMRELIARLARDGLGMVLYIN
jgi:Domain of unknown function (DUF1877)